MISLSQEINTLFYIGNLPYFPYLIDIRHQIQEEGTHEVFYFAERGVSLILPISPILPLHNFPVLYRSLISLITYTTCNIITTDTTEFSVCSRYHHIPLFSLPELTHRVIFHLLAAFAGALFCAPRLTTFAFAASSIALIIASTATNRSLGGRDDFA